MKRYTVDEYTLYFFGNVKKRVADAYGVHPQQVTDWKAAGMFFLVDGDHHERCNTRQSLKYIENK